MHIEHAPYSTYTVVVYINTMKMIIDLNFRFLQSFPTVWMDTHTHENKSCQLTA